MRNQGLWTLVTVAAAGLALAGCGVVVKGGPLSGRPETGHGIYLSTGGSPRPFRTLGFAEIRGYGVNIAGMTDVGDAALDGTIRGKLVEVAAQMGGDAVVNIEFLDENPPTTMERISAATSTINDSMRSGRPRIKTQDRWVTVTGEIIKFVGK